MINDVERILLTEEQIQQKVAEIGKRITEEYRDKNPIFVGVLKGCFIFMADLMRTVEIPCSMDFMAVSSYSGATSTGAVKINKDLSEDIAGRHVILVEDILDTGRTLQRLVDYYRELGAEDVRICVMLDKPEAHRVPIQAEYVGAEVGDAFIVGYGLDYAQRYRNLPYIGILKPEIYA